MQNGLDLVYDAEKEFQEVDEQGISLWICNIVAKSGNEAASSNCLEKEVSVEVRRLRVIVR